MTMNLDELKTRIEAKRHELEARLNELKANAQQVAADAKADAKDELSTLETKLKDLSELLREGWDHLTDRVSDQLRSWLKTAEETGHKVQNLAEQKLADLKRDPGAHDTNSGTARSRT
jgi:archaellum component FlaC